MHAEYQQQNSLHFQKTAE